MRASTIAVWTNVLALLDHRGVRQGIVTLTLIAPPRACRPAQNTTQAVQMGLAPVPRAQRMFAVRHARSALIALTNAQASRRIPEEHAAVSARVHTRQSPIVRQ